MRLAYRIGMVISLVAALMVGVLPRAASAAAISTPGPLTSINVSNQLLCQVRYLGDKQPEWDQSSQCGTSIRLNGTTYSPPGGGKVKGTNFTQVSQTAVTGGGTAADPFRIVTVVRAGSHATLTQTDTYVSGNDFYTTGLTVANDTGGPLDGIVYFAGDCDLADVTTGYGRIDGTSPSCTVTQDPDSRAITLIPGTSGNRYQVSDPDDIWTTIIDGADLGNSCGTCDQRVDQGAAISWAVSMGAGAVLTNTALVTAPDSTDPAGVSAAASVIVAASAHLVLTKPWSRPATRRCRPARATGRPARSPRGPSTAPTWAPSPWAARSR